MKFTSLHKALDIIQLLYDRKGFMEFNEISQSLDMPRSSTYKYLSVLKERGFLDFERSTKRYRLGLKFVELGKLVQSQVKFDKIALPYMEKVAEVMGETVILSYLSSGAAYCLERVGPESGLVFSMQRGANLPLYSGASAKVLLAQLPDSEIDEILKRLQFHQLTHNTITEPEKLKQNLIEIRAKGYAYSDQETDLGARAVAAPIVNVSLGIIAGLCIAGPVHRMKGEKLKQAQKLAIETAKEISRNLTTS